LTGRKSQVVSNLSFKEESRMAEQEVSTGKVWSIFNFDRVEKPEDLKPKRGMNINPPPSDGRCDCCGRPMSELTPFGGRGDPLVGDFRGALLVKGYRPMGPYDDEAEEACNEAENKFKADGHEDPEAWLIAKYGPQEGKRLYLTACAHGQVGSSWECRDCFVLSLDEYFERVRTRYREEQKQERAEQVPEEPGPQ
jgi:hypothetical protein